MQAGGLSAADLGALRMQVGGNEPASGPVLWFDTRPLEKTRVVLLKLGEAGGDGAVTAEVDGVSYPVENAAGGSAPTGDTFILEIL